MPQHQKRLCLILAMMVGFANAESLGDLVPILALFGERITLQFMGQALGWADCVAVAMAPLGIITVLVGAIRVGGPTWLKAVVGRTKENISVVEMELMSSTSHEVCDLYKGETIVRCRGSAPIREYICLFPKNFNSNSDRKLKFRFKTLAQAVQDGLLEGPAEQTDLSQEKGTSGIQSLSAQYDNAHARTTYSDQEQPERAAGSAAITVIRDTSLDSPNISLNLQNTHERGFIRAVALFGVLLQLSVLLFSGMMAYHPKLRPKFQNHGKPVAAHAFPVTAVGTVLLVLGLLLCAHVIEDSTEEKHYKASNGSEIGIYWLQRGKTIKDQVFWPFATHTSTRRDVFTMSRRKKERAVGVLESKTIVGVSIGLVGFVAQFVGLRAMNSTAMLAQLGAVGIMTVLRLLDRPVFEGTFQKAKLLPGFELDWLAWKLVTTRDQAQLETLPESHPEAGVSSSPTQPSGTTDGESKHVRLGSWAVATGGKMEYKKLEPLTNDMNDQTPPSTAQDILMVRRELCKLAALQGRASTEAINIAMAIEKALNVLFPRGTEVEGSRGFRWLLDVELSGPASREAVRSASIKEVSRASSEAASSNSSEEVSPASTEQVKTQVWFDLFYNGTWKVFADNFDSALSLWTYTAQDQEEKQKAEYQRQKVIDFSDDSWLLNQLPHRSIRLVGPENDTTKEQLVSDLQWWMPQGLEGLINIKETQGSDDASSAAKYSKSFDHSRVVGCGPSARQSVHLGSFAGDFDFFETWAERDVALAFEGDDSLEKLYAKDLLFSFMCSAAKSLGAPVEGKPETPPTAGIEDFRKPGRFLMNEDLADLAEAFRKLDFGSEQEVFSSIISPLSMAKKLRRITPKADTQDEGGDTALRPTIGHIARMQDPPSHDIGGPTSSRKRSGLLKHGGHGSAT
ncbi:hypothetical protein QQX98_008016 [Neonectria punicea]|uniref:Uncharacterized protein n=1 Tax=Neonectria punicea TaxID=979145 RepID=A0ABR1GWB9_9HYPO